MTWISAKKIAAVATVAGVAALTVSGVTAVPTKNLLAIREANPFVWGSNIGNLVATVKQFLMDVDAFNLSVPDKCKITISTAGGGDCQTFLYCGDGHTLNGQDEIGHSAGDWQVCYLGGEQFLHDDDLGDFSVTFTKAGGVDGNNEDGLHHPVLKIAGVNDWEPLDIRAVIDEQGDSMEGRVCKRKKTGTTQSITWTCGVPKLGANSLFGMSNYGQDTEEEGYTPGWCTAHVSQYQRNEFGNGLNYAFDVIIYDGDGKQISKTQHEPVDDQGYLNVESRLPLSLVVEVGNDDADYVSFAYGDQSWTCDDDDGGAHDCTLGNGKRKGYENGSRNGDMGWTC